MTSKSASILSFLKTQSSSLIPFLSQNKIKTCISETQLPPCVKDTLSSQNIQIFEYGHPDDMKILQEYSVLTHEGYSILFTAIEVSVSTSQITLQLQYDGPITILDPPYSSWKGDTFERLLALYTDYSLYNRVLPGGALTETLLIQSFPLLAVPLTQYVHCLYSNLCPEGSSWANVLCSFPTSFQGTVESLSSLTPAASQIHDSYASKYHLHRKRMLEAVVEVTLQVLRLSLT